MVRRLVPLLATCLAALSCGRLDTRAAPGTARGAIVGGVADPGHPAVGAVILAKGLCSGSLIAPRVVLTAAHCLVDGGDPIAFVLGPSAFGPQLDFADRRVHPGYSVHQEGGVEVAWHDVAALILARPAPVAPMAWQPRLPDGFLQSTVTLVGFGQGTTEPAGDKRTVDVVVSDVWSHGFWNATSLPNPVNSCEGDSGAPVLQDDGGVEVIVGVVSSGDPQCVKSGYNIRLDMEADFLDPILAQFEEAPEDPGDAAEPDEDLPAVLADETGPGEAGFEEAVPEAADLPLPIDVARETAEIPETSDDPLCGDGNSPLCETQGRDSDPREYASSAGGGCSTSPISSSVPALSFLLLALALVRRFASR